MPHTFINGFEMHYNLFGSGAPLILVHGLGLDQSMWDLQVPVLSAAYQVVVFDLRGHGQSESPDQPYTIELFADDLHTLMRFLGLRRTAALGLSLGGRIVLSWALKYPEETRALVLADTQSETPAESRQNFHLLAGVAREEGMGRAAEILFSLPLFQSLAEANPSRYRQEKERLSRSSPVGFARSCLAIAQMEPLTDRLSAIATPTLALAGEKDGPYLPFLDLYARRIPQCKKLILPRAGHLSNLENPEDFNRAVQSFLNGLS
ncbi:MAG: alpha/beta fold hydrolase [Deltaproteobacteria bacterium]|nr:alpha/beta fold hydrolase [Deltaproteobacteria bacterium]